MVQQNGFVRVQGFDVKDGPFEKAALKSVLHKGASADRSREGKQAPQTPQASREPGFKGLLALCSAGPIYPTSPQGLLHMGRVEVAGTAHTTAGVRNLVKAVVRGLRACQVPVPVEGGLGGTYLFLSEAGRKCGIVKPCDEEPLACNNPKGYVGRNLGDPGLKPTVRVGEAALREVAAYLLDHDHFAGVPHTVLVKVTHPIFHVAAAPTSPSPLSPASNAAITPQLQLEMPASPSANGGNGGCTSAPATPSGPSVPCKLGSLQEFVNHECDTSEIGMSQFSYRDVHRIGILDIRLFNTDRHAGNILVRRPRGSSANLGALARLEEGELELIPIDHGFALPEALEPPYFEWLFWPQAMIPFDEDELAYIAALNPAEDADLLRRELPSLHEGCLRVLEVATTVLQHCAAAGLSLAEIGTVVSRPLVGLEEEPSELEKLCLLARAEVDAAVLGRSGMLDSIPSESESDEDDSMSESEEEDSEAACRMAAGMHLARHGRAGRGSRRSSRSELTGITRAFTDSSFEICCVDSPYMFKGAGQLVSARTPSDNQCSLLPSMHGSVSNVELTSASTTASLRSSDDEQLPVSSLLSDSAHARMSPPRPTVSLVVDSRMPSESASDSPISPDSVISNMFCSQDSLNSSGTTFAAPTLIRHVSMDSGLTPAFAPHTDLMVSGFHGGLKWRGSPQRQRGRRHQRRADTLKPRRITAGQAYPPPVVGAAPHTVSTVFAGLDADGWGLFMAALVSLMEAALQEGRWKKAAQQGPAGLQNMGVSCPRF